MPADDLIYLDYNATTPVLPEVLDAMVPYLREHFGNPSSGHPYGRRAREAVDEARGELAALLGCARDEVVFTGGGTEANNLAIRGVAEARAGESPRGCVVTSVIEHPATTNPCRWLEHNGWSVAWLPVNARGRIEPGAMARALAERGGRCALVTVMHANNETGVIQPVAELAALGRAAGAVVHTDAAQSVGKVPTRVDDLGVDLLSIAGHKLYAPKGVGALYVRRGTPLAPFARGAGHERGVRPGTENVASIVGLGVAARVALRELEREGARVRALRERLWEALAARVPGLEVHGELDARLPNTLNVGFPGGVSGTALLAQAPGVAASTGSACHDGHESASGVLLAMGIATEPALGAVRLTLGRGTTAEQVDRAVEQLAQAWYTLRDRDARG